MELFDDQFIDSMAHTFQRIVDDLTEAKQIYDFFTEFSTLEKFEEMEGETPEQKLSRFEAFSNQTRLTQNNFLTEIDKVQNLLCPLNQYREALSQIIRQTSQNITTQTKEVENELDRLTEEVTGKPIENMHIFVKTLTGKTLEFNVRKQSTCDDLKRLITTSEGIPPDQQRLVFDGQQLEDLGLLTSYGIGNGDTIHLILRLRGGKPVILLYDDEMKENEEITISLRMNEAMGLGATYPEPQKKDESDEKKKKYEWKGNYTSLGKKEECCKITINDKIYDYIFWEGPCYKEEEFKGEIIGMKKENFVEELEILLKKLGLNERERNDFIVYWITKLSKRKFHKVTICDKSYDNLIAPLEINGFNQIHRVMLKFEESETIEGLKTIHDIETIKRPEGKYIIEWGAILA